MSLDVNNNYTGTFYGTDRHGYTTPDPEGSEFLRPFVPNAYAAPWLPIRRRDEGHPVGAGKVLSAGYSVGFDKSGGLVPAGMLSGSQPASALNDISGYCLVKYGADDVGFTLNPRTGVKVAAAGEYVLIAAPSNAVATTVVDGVAILSGDITFAQACNLIPGGRARPVGWAIRDVMQYIGGSIVGSTTGGVLYTVDSMNPTTYAVHNYMHEMATAIQTQAVLRMPWIGTTPGALTTLAASDGVAGYTQTDFSKSFVHMTGDTSINTDLGGLFLGASVVPSSVNGAKDAGHFAAYNSAKHSFSDICGRVLSIDNQYPIKNFADRVRTQFDRNESFVGPFKESNPVTGLMGGSATRGLEYMVSLGTNGLFRKYIDQGIAPRPEASTIVRLHVRF